MSDTIQDLYSSFSEQMGPIQDEDRYFRYLYEMLQASDTTLEQKREVLVKQVDERWIKAVEDTLDSINTIIEHPRRFITTEEELVPVALARKISAESVRHLSQHTQYIDPSEDGEIHPSKILNVSTQETYDLYENRFIFHLIKRLITFIDKRTDVIFWSTGNETCNHFVMKTKVEDAYEEITYNLDMVVKNRQSLAENDADNMDVFMRIDRVRRLVMSLRRSAFYEIMNGCAKVRSPIQRTNLIMKDPDYRKCYQLWQFMEEYDEVGYVIDVQDTEMAFDDEYLVQMYTNFINNYTVFKSLTEDERNLKEIEVTRHEVKRPVFVKEIVEEIVDDCNIPDVEIRQVFVEEVTEAQLAAEAALEKEIETRKGLEVQLDESHQQIVSMSHERESLLDQIEASRTKVEEAEKRVVAADKSRMEAEAAKVDALAAAEVAEKARAKAERECAEARADAEATKAEADEAIAAAKDEADAAVEAAKAEADAAVAAAKADADAAVATARSEADAAVAVARADAESAIATTKEEADAAVAAAKAEAESAIAAANADAEAAKAQADEAIESARATASSEVQAAKAQADEAIAAAKAQAEADTTKAREEAELQIRTSKENAEAAVAKARQDAEAEVATIRSESDATIEHERLVHENNLKYARKEAEDTLSKTCAGYEDELAQLRETSARERAVAESEITELRNQLKAMERERDRALRKAEGNSISRYLLKRLKSSGSEEPNEDQDE